MNHRPGSPCPDPKCKGSLREDEYGIFCALCGAETDTWAEPADADLPVRLEDAPPAPPVMLRPRRAKRLAPRLALAALLIAGAGVGTWFALRSTPVEARVAPIETADVLAALRDQKWPEGLALPAYYSDHELFFLKKHRAAQSPLMNSWNAYSRDEKLELLSQVMELYTPFALPYVAEIAYFTLPQEDDEHLARNVFAALAASCHEYIDIGIFVADFVAQSAAQAEVAHHAEECRLALVDRRQRLGR
ncbi:MAG: hypothetical protein JNM84_06955 [Planctomycetes bacterium]|nr:hypothetical protein [Planctomycetota bacterium]